MSGVQVQRSKAVEDRYSGVDRRAALDRGGDGYRGPDRRTTRALTRLARPRLEAAAAIVVAALVVLLAVGVRSVVREEVAYLVLRNLASVLLLLAGTAYALSWRLTGRAAAALHGAGFLVLGGLTIPLQALAYVLHGDPLLQQLAPEVGIVLGGVAVTQCARAARSRPVDAAARPGRGAAPATVGAVAVLAGLAALRLARGPLDAAVPWAVATAVLGLAWLAAAGLALRPAGGAARRPLLAAGLGVLGASDLLLAVGIVHRPAVASVAAAVSVLGSAVVLAAAARTLDGSLGQHGDRSIRLAGELGDTVRLLADEQAAREAMLHDARSALAAVRLANGTLAQYRERLDALLAAELSDAVDAELGRLEHLLTDAPERRITRCLLADVAAPVVRVAAEGGLPVQADLTGLPPVLARGEELGEVLHTLLANAGRYAAGAPVEVTGRVDGAVLRLTVADRGPGVDDDERERIFGRGLRGRASAGHAGSGLGLYVARWLMAEMGGALHVEPRPGGGACFVATVPLADAPALAVAC